METSPSPKPTFNDAAGTEWTIALDFAALRRIKTGAQVDLGQFEQLAQQWAPLLCDNLRALSVVWFAVEPTATANGVTREAFEALMNGETLDAARQALEVAVVNFCPSQSQVAASALSGVREGLQRAMAQAGERIRTELEKTTENALAALGKQPPRSRAFSGTGKKRGR